MCLLRQRSKGKNPKNYGVVGVYRIAEVEKHWALRAMTWFKLRGFIILKSSKNHYHVVFDKTVTWEKNMHVMAWVALESGNPKLKDYLVMQCIKESSTLRISSKHDKPSPRIIFTYGKQNMQINYFIRMRYFVKRIGKKTKFSKMN